MLPVPGTTAENATRVGKIDNVTCLKGHAEDQLRAMLEKELLPKYTKVFLQQEENRGPENEEMEKWLQVKHYSI